MKETMERLLEATKCGAAKWETTSSQLSFKVKFEDRLYKIYQDNKGETEMFVMNEKFDFVNINELKNTDILKKIYDEILFKNPDYEKQVGDYLIENEDYEMLKTEINITPELAEKYDLRPGMGLSFVQIGIKKRIFVIVYEKDDKEFETYVVINPKLLSNSEEMVYIAEGEGCLSVNREVCGIVPRYARINIEYYDEEGNKHIKRMREELSVAFQHEMDHLDGILFVDKIDKKDPYKDMDKMREI